MTISRLARLALSLGFAMCVGLASVPLGCGGSEDAVYSGPRPREDPNVPEDVAKQLEACARQTAAPFPPAEGNTYVVTFDVHVSKPGSVHAVKVEDSMLGGHDVEGCFERVLRAMTLPKRTIAMGLEGSAPRGAAAPPSRALLGQAFAIPNPFSLVPVVITIAAVTIAVWVVVHVVSEVGTSTTTVAPPVVTAIPVASAVPSTTAIPIATVVPRDPALERYCLKLQEECLENRRQPRANQKKYGPTKPCFDCFRICVEHTPWEWPDYKCPRGR